MNGLRDGETVFVKTWACNYPDGEVMDGLLADAKVRVKLTGGTPENLC